MRNKEAAAWSVCLLSIFCLGCDAFQTGCLSSIRNNVAGLNKCTLNKNQFSLTAFPKQSVHKSRHPALIQMSAKTAVITGSSSGIGLAAAKELTSKVFLFFQT
jgi:hypothetical protein